ncbi:MAG TPA: hypothetical protein VII40_17285, partial [Xanthobacteraceae bacterium]
MRVRARHLAAASWLAALLGGAAPARPVPVAPATQAPAANAAHELDLAYGAFQRGYYLTAFAEATKRINEKGDPKSMTLIAELYANGLGVANND